MRIARHWRRYALRRPLRDSLGAATEQPCDDAPVTAARASLENGSAAELPCLRGAARHPSGRFWMNAICCCGAKTSASQTQEPPGQADHPRHKPADVAEDESRHTAVRNPAAAEDTLSPIGAVSFVSISAMAAEAGRPERHTDDEASLQEAVEARLFDRRAYSQRYSQRRPVISLTMTLLCKLTRWCLIFAVRAAAMRLRVSGCWRACRGPTPGWTLGGRASRWASRKLPSTARRPP